MTESKKRVKKLTFLKRLMLLFSLIGIFGSFIVYFSIVSINNKLSNDIDVQTNIEIAFNQHLNRCYNYVEDGGYLHNDETITIAKLQIVLAEKLYHEEIGSDIIKIVNLPVRELTYRQKLSSYQKNILDYHNDFNNDIKKSVFNTERFGGKEFYFTVLIHKYLNDGKNLYYSTAILIFLTLLIYVIEAFCKKIYS